MKTFDERSLRDLREVGADGLLRKAVATHVCENQRTRVRVVRLRADHARDGEGVRRFLTQARKAAAFSHAGMAPVVDYGYSGDGPTLAYAAPRDAVSLGRLLSAASANSLPLPTPVVFHIARELCSTLIEAHAQPDGGLVHGNLCADTVLILPNGQTQLVELGLWASLLPSVAQRVRFEHLHIGHLPPETLATGSFDARADVFAIGVILYRMLSGVDPFSRDSAIKTAVAINNAQFAAPLPQGTTRSVVDALDGLLARDANRRLQTAGAALAALSSLYIDLDAQALLASLVQALRPSTSQLLASQTTSDVPALRGAAARVATADFTPPTAWPAADMATAPVPPTLLGEATMQPPAPPPDSAGPKRPHGAANAGFRRTQMFTALNAAQGTGSTGPAQSAATALPTGATPAAQEPTTGVQPALGRKYSVELPAMLGPVTEPEPQPVVLTSPKQGLSRIRAATTELPPIISVGGPAPQAQTAAPAAPHAPTGGGTPAPAPLARAMSMPDMPPFFGIASPSAPPPEPASPPAQRSHVDALPKTGTMMLDIEDQPGSPRAPVHAPSAAAYSASSPELPAMLRGHTGSASAYAQPTGTRRNVVPPGAFAIGQLTDSVRPSEPPRSPSVVPQSAGTDPRRPALRPMTMPPIDFGDAAVPTPSFPSPASPNLSDQLFGQNTPSLTAESAGLVRFKPPEEFRGSGRVDTDRVTAGAAWREPSRTVFATKARNLEVTKRTAVRTSGLGIGVAAALLGFSVVLGFLLVRRILH